MFRSLLPRLFGEDQRESGLTADDAEMAVAALLVRVARADHDYQDEERTLIETLLARRKGLSAADAADRRAAAEMLEAEAPDTVRFTRALKERVPLDQRAAVVSAMWRIALADGLRTAGEDSAIRLAASLLGVSDVASALARQEVERSMAENEPEGVAPDQPPQ